MRPDLTKRADYAIRAMIALARSSRSEQLSARQIADQKSNPAPGRFGGHRLARPAREIDLLTIIEAIEGDSRRRSCVLRGGPCNAAGQCDIHAVFDAAQSALLASLAEADLATIAGPR